MKKNKLRTASMVAALSFAGAVSNAASADVLQGVFDDVYESSYYAIGSGDSTLTFQWSTASPDLSGYFYAGGPDGIGVHVFAGLADPTTVTNAASFVYETIGAPVATEGDTVFLRNSSGVYAAIALKDFVKLDPPVPAPGASFSYLSTLDADWYVDTTGTGNFSTTPVPEPSAYALMIAGLALVAYRRRSRRSVDQSETRRERYDARARQWSGATDNAPGS
jgi:hypothetical protein